MNLTFQKRMASELLKCSPKKIRFDAESLSDINESITKESIRALINTGKIWRLPPNTISRGRARKRLIQIRKGRRKGLGSRKGKRTARLRPKTEWMNKIRLQRNLIQVLRDKKLIEPNVYRMLYRKVKGGFFRSKRHLKLYIEEQGVVKQGKK